MYDTLYQVIIVLASLATSIGLAFLPDWTKKTFSLPEQVILSVTLFSAFILLDLCYLVSKRLQLKIKEVRLWKLKELGDRELSNVRESFFKLIENSYGDKDLFVTHFIKHLRQLEQEIKQAADTNELYVQADHFLSAKNILDGFLGSEERVVRWTWPVSGNDKLFDDLPWKHFFEKTAQMAQSGNIKSVKAIFIIDSSDEIDSPRFQKLLRFFKTNPNMECRLILAKDYQYVCRDNHVPSNYQDFGIYGDRLLYRTYEEAKGAFSKHSPTIENYIKLFDTMWSSVGITRENPSTDSTKVTIEDLFSFDEREV